MGQPEIPTLSQKARQGWGIRCNRLFSFVGAGGTDAGADIPAGHAIWIAGGDVIERSFIGGSVRILTVGQSKSLIARRSQMAGGIRDARKGG